MNVWIPQVLNNGLQRTRWFVHSIAISANVLSESLTKTHFLSFDILESASRSYNSNSFPGQSGSSVRSPEKSSCSTSGARFFGTSVPYDPFCKPVDHLFQRPSNSFYGGSYQDAFQPPAKTQDQYQRDSEFNSQSAHQQRMQKKKKRSGRGKKHHEEVDEEVQVKENGEWDADYHLFGLKSPRSRTVRSSELPETTKL